MKEIFKTLIVGIITLQARLVLNKYKPRIILVTGSVGKTSTKDALYEVLAQHIFVRKSEKSFNSEVGVPLTILGLPNGWTNILKWLQNIVDGLLLILVRVPYPRWLIAEVSADRPGDISKRLRWIEPDVVVTTAFPDISVHVEFYDSPEAVIEEEFSPVSFLKPDGVLVSSYDDENTKKRLDNFSGRKILYGFEKEADVRVLRYHTLSRKGVPTGISFDITYQDEKIHVTKNGVVGKTHVYAALAGVASALAIDVPFSDISDTNDGVTASPNGRLKLIEGKQCTIIDDTYNSSPAAVKEALWTLESIPTPGKKFAVLADMMELGEYSKQAHITAGEYAVGKTDILVTIGVRARGIAEAARTAGMNENAVHSFEKKEDAAAYLLSSVETGDIVLIKGSQSMRLEKIVKALMAHPEKAEELLVRQDTEWLSR